MKAQFLKIAGVNSEEEFYNMFPTEESFFRAHPEAQQMAQGGATYPYPGQATADEFFNYGMQGKGAGAQIPVETWFAYGGFTSKPSATLVHYGDGGMGQYSHPSNYGAFPAFAQKGNQVQGGGIDAATSSRLKNFLSGIQANTQKALNDQAMEEAMQMNQELMPQLIAQYGAEMGSRFNPNMYGQNMMQNTLDQLNDENQMATRDFLNMGKRFAYNISNNILENQLDKMRKEEQKDFDMFTKDMQTSPDFNPIPENMAKLGGSLKKYQGGGYKSPVFPSDDLNIDLIVQQNAKRAEELKKQKLTEKQQKLTEKQIKEQQEKDNEDINNIIQIKNKRDFLVKTFNENPEGWNTGKSLADYTGLREDYYTRYAEPKDLTNAIKKLDASYKAAYNKYYTDRGLSTPSTTPVTTTAAKPAATSQCGPGQQWSSTYKACYTPITSNDQYYGGIGNSNKSSDQLIAEKEWTRDPNHLLYAEWKKTQSESQQTPAQTPASAKPQATAPVPATPKAPATPAKKQITEADTTGLAAFKQKYNVKKQGGQIIKYNGGGSVTADDGTFRAFEDGSIYNIKTNTWVQNANPNWKPEGVPSMKYEGTEQPTEKTTGTTTTTTSGDITDPKEKAIKALAEAYGVDPNQTWEAFQNMTTYGTMGAGTQQPYGYGVSSMVPYRYRHRGYGSIGWDRGYVPGDLDLRAMEEQAMKMGYDFYGKSRPTLFGGRKVVIKTRYNPNTGVVETKPEVERESDSTWHPPMAIPGASTEPTKNYDFVQAANSDTPVNKEEFMKGKIAQDIADLEEGIPLAEPRQGFKYGGLNRFLPKHQVMGETGLKFDNLDINIPIMDTIHNIGEKYQHGLTSIKDFNQERKQKRDERRGTDEKAVWKTGPSPYAAENVLTTMAFASNLGRGKERRELEEDLANKMSSDYMFTAVGKDRGDYDPKGKFRPNQKTPTFDTGYQRGNANRPYYGGFDKGGSPGYSDWSQTPVNGYYGIPTGEMTMYPHWTQAPVMQMGGVPSTEQYLTDEEIAEIIQMGGQVEYLD